MPSVEEEDAEAAASGAGIPGAGACAHRKSHRRVARHPGRSGEAASSFLGRRHEGSCGTGDGRPLPTHLVAELNRLRRRLSLTLEMIRELDAVREQALEAQHDLASRTVKALCTIRGIGVNFASVLTREVFYRMFDNRRQPASYLGLRPNAFSERRHGDRERRINRAGNSRARKTLFQPAWLWLRYQPESSHAAWFRDRVGSLQGRIRRITIVALARKLLIAIWRSSRWASHRRGDHRRIEFRRRSISGG